MKTNNWHTYFCYNVLQSDDSYYLCQKKVFSCWEHLCFSELSIRILLLWSLLYIKSWLYLKGWNRYLYICISCIFLSVDIRPVGEVTLFLQRWCGWNSSLEAILDVPETWKVTTQNHSLLQRKIQQPNYSSDIVLNNLLIGLRYISFWIFRRRCNIEIL